MINFLKINLNYVAKIGLKIAGTLFSLLTLLLTFISWDDIGITSRCDRLLILVVILGIAVIIAIGFLFVKKCNVIWEQ